MESPFSFLSPRLAFCENCMLLPIRWRTEARNGLQPVIFMHAIERDMGRGGDSDMSPSCTAKV